jgi:hypothetical protein
VLRLQVIETEGVAGADDEALVGHGRELLKPVSRTSLDRAFAGA